MSTVVLVHGIAQEQLSADGLEGVWLPALAGGVRASGHPELADRLWRDARPGDVSARMAFYGDLFLDPDAQGFPDLTFSDRDLEGAELADQLAALWLENATHYADDPRDRDEAHRQLAALYNDQTGAQGPRAAVRPTMNALSRLRWFAPLGVGLAGRFVTRALSQVTRYLRDDALRTSAQDRILDHIDSSTRLVVSHSLGTVIAYEALHRNTQPVALLTLGSPLGLHTIIYERLRPQPPHVPAAVTRWDNLVDGDDLVAAHLDLSPYFPPAPGSTVRPTTPPAIDNGAKPHDATHYLAKRSVGRIVAAALES
jgi:hypothetical protein